MSVKGESSKSTVVGNLHKELKAVVPERFDGNQQKLKAFFTQVELYIGFNLAKFNSETE